MRLPRSCVRVSINFTDAPADHSPDVLAVAPCTIPALANTPSLPEHSPSLVRSTITLDNASFPAKIATNNSGTATSTAFGCVTLLETGSPHTFIRREVKEQMISAGAVTIYFAGRTLLLVPEGYFRKPFPLRTLTSVCLSAQMFRISVWACVVPPSIMQHEVLLGRDSWMRFNTRSYRSLPPSPSV